MRSHKKKHPASSPPAEEKSGDKVEAPVSPAQPTPARPSPDEIDAAKAVMQDAAKTDSTRDVMGRIKATGRPKGAKTGGGKTTAAKHTAMVGFVSDCWCAPFGIVAGRLGPWWKLEKEEAELLGERTVEAATAWGVDLKLAHKWIALGALIGATVNVVSDRVKKTRIAALSAQAKQPPSPPQAPPSGPQGVVPDDDSIPGLTAPPKAALRQAQGSAAVAG